MKGWRDAGFEVETGHVRMADPPTDVWYRPYDFKEDVEAAMRQYLDWEVDLVPQVEARRRPVLRPEAVERRNGLHFRALSHCRVRLTPRGPANGFRRVFIVTASCWWGGGGKARSGASGYG